MTPDPADVAPVALELCRRHAGERGSLLQALVRLQQRFHHIPPSAFPPLEDAFKKTRAELRAVIGFYSFLSESPQGEYVIHLSDNIIDRMGGGPALLKQLCRRLRVTPGQPRADGRVSVHRTSCTGMADQGPAGLVNYRAITRLTPERIDQIAGLIEERAPLSAWPDELFTVGDNLRRSDVCFRRPIEPGAALRAAFKRGEVTIGGAQDDDNFDPSVIGPVTMDRGAMETLRELYKADLRGCGGAGFRAAVKWEGARERASANRYVLGNADEGEPGTFKDRVLLTRYADMVIEGMTLCGYLIGARRGVLYVRQEYAYLEPHLLEVLERRRAMNLLGPRILATALDFDVEIHWGAGAYICGMETAMIDSIEGKRGVPRRRFPLPVVQGLHGEPTVVNNVETFAAAAVISARGGAWFAQQGVAQSHGTKLFCVSGDCERPGLYEYPWGISVRELLRDCGAPAPQAIQVGGPSGRLIAPTEFDRALCFEDLPTVGTMMIFGPQRDLFEQVRGFAEFFQHESCGLCTPCRVGTTLIHQKLDRFHARAGSSLDLQEIVRLGRLMRLASHCGLGQTAANPALDAIAKFPELFARRAQANDGGPAFDLDLALKEARRLSGRPDPNFLSD